jgi:hypothetical protein
MAALVADSVLNANEERTFMINGSLIFVVNHRLKNLVNEPLGAWEHRIDPGKSAA